MEAKNALMRGSIKKIIAYYSYPTGTVGSSHIESTNEKDTALYNKVEYALNQAVQRLGIKRDNKEAVKCEIEGMDQPVYLCAYDFERIATFEISSNRGGSEYLIPEEEDFKTKAIKAIENAIVEDAKVNDDDSHRHAYEHTIEILKALN